MAKIGYIMTAPANLLPGVLPHEQHSLNLYLWVRPEKMFFEHVTRDVRTFSRFLETEI